MKKRKKKLKIPRIIKIVFILIIIFFILRKSFITFKKSSNRPESIVSKETSTNYDESNKNNTRDLNHLSDTEASFGEIDKPLYKKGEKELNLPIIIYHAFQTPVPEDDIYKLFSTEERFEENVTTLLDAGYTFITLEDLYKYNKGYIGLPEKNVIITMDDGWRGCYTEAFNVVKKYNIPVTIFIVENLVGKEGYFSWEEAKEMYDTGLVKIHVHGQKHINATDYSSKEQLISAYNHAHETIQENLGDNNIQKIMAYPAGKSSDNTINWLKDAGFEIQVQTRYGVVNKSSDLDLTNLGRVRGEQASGRTILRAIEK